jgi:putative spermidine/putrescine transport system permease protein
MAYPIAHLLATSTNEVQQPIDDLCSVTVLDLIASSDSKLDDITSATMELLTTFFVTIGLRMLTIIDLEMMYNKTGTYVAMTQILLPFMVLPLYSVMKTISPSLMRAGKSLGGTPFVAFWKVYFPLTIPGIGAGCLLVFILAIGYYITPALVGGASGTLISNQIAFHMKSTLDWSFASAMGLMLLTGVLAIYWIYNKLVGIDNIKLG